MTALSPLRLGRITGSRIAGVLGVSPWDTPDDVMRDMVRQALALPDEFVGNAATRHGDEHELDGIADWEERNQLTLEGTGDYQQFLTHPEIPFLGVTPDGIAAPDGIVEVKAPLWGGYSHWREVPWYEAQVRLIIECAQASWGDLAVWRAEGTTISRIERDPWWLEGQYPVLETFHERYLTILADPAAQAPYIKPLVDERRDPEWVDAAERWRELAALARVAAEEEADAKRALIELAGGGVEKSKTRGHGVSVTTYERAGQVKWKDFKAAYAPEADETQYRGASSLVTTVRLVTDKT